MERPSREPVGDGSDYTLLFRHNIWLLRQSDDRGGHTTLQAAPHCHQHLHLLPGHSRGGPVCLQPPLTAPLPD